MRPGRSATVRDVAALAGVSTATVSRALDPLTGDLVKKETRAKVLEAAKQLEYSANHIARSLKTRSTRMVAIVAPELANDFFMELAEGMERELEASGYTLLVASSDNSTEEEARRLATLSDRLVDGIAVIPAGSRGDHIQHLSERGIPVVLVDRIVEGTRLDAVLSDNEGGAADLTRALLADGFRRIAFLGGDVTISTARERLAGFARALAEAGLSPESGELRLGGMGLEDGYRRMDELLSGDTLPDAILAVNLLVHLGLHRRLLEAHGRDRLGMSFAIAAFDETPYSPFLPHCRYSAAQDAAGLGVAAARRILQRISERRNDERSGFRGGADVTTVRLPVSLIRHQCGWSAIQ